MRNRSTASANISAAAKTRAANSSSAPTPSLESARFEVAVIRPDAAEPKIFSFLIATPTKDGVVELGLTGADWPGGKSAHPVAWKLTLRAADGKVLAEQKSFLWENPAK